MSPSELRAPIIAAVERTLISAGYRRSASLFLRELASVFHLIEVQGSRQSTSTSAKFTINIGVFAPVLIYPDVRKFRKPSIPAAHWRQRIGALSPEAEDLWWRVTTLQEAQAAAKDIALRIERFALPALARVSNVESLSALWSTGHSPGITDKQRQEYLAMLKQAQVSTENAA
jgi:hypothetical protein